MARRTLLLTHAFHPAVLASITLLGLLSGCSKPKGESTQADGELSASTAPASTSESTAVGPAKPGAHGSGGANPKVRKTLSWNDLQTDVLKDGIAPPDASPIAPASTTGDAPGSVAGPPLTFGRIAGGDGYFCGVLKAGPIRCWGSKNDLYPGAFVDLAVADLGVCGATASGTVDCFGAGDPAGLSGVKRVTSGDSNFCALTSTGAVSCWDKDGQPVLPAPEGLKAVFVAAGDGFVCAANQERALSCWGAIERLSLPPAPLAIKDVAAGSDFVCAIDQSDALRCFGRNFDLEAIGASAIAAAGGSLCVRRKNGSAECRGDIEVSFAAPVGRLGVGRSAACKLDDAGTPECQGREISEQLEIPRSASSGPAAGATTQPTEGDFAAYLELFEPATLPLELGRMGTFTVGDRISSRYDGLLSGSANEYRAGVRVALPSGAIAVTVLHMNSGTLELRTYSAAGKLAKLRTIAAHQTSSTPIEDAPDGSGTLTSSVKTTESRIVADGIVETASYEATEVTHYVAQHRDGTRPISRIVCTITGTESADRIEKDGNLKRQNAHILPARSTTDAKGCDGAWPMVR